MAGALYVQLTLCPRASFLLTGKIGCSVKATDLRHFQNGTKKLTEYILKRSIKSFTKVDQTLCRKPNYLGRCDFPVFLSIRNCRLLSFSCYRQLSHINNADDCGGKLDAKEHINHADSETKIDDPELKSILKDLSNDFDNEITEEIKNEDSHKQTLEVSDSSKLENYLDSTQVNNKDADFEYDYQVAEDIEEYDYIDDNNVLTEQQIRPEKVLPIGLERGKNGVFDLDELVTLLTHLGAENIVTFPIPPEVNYCDHMVVVSAKSSRHLQAINDEMLWVHKRKKSKKDAHLIIEGMTKSTWCAMDLGNIVLHVFFGNQREYYDIESLWTLGPDADPKCQELDVDRYILSPENLFWLETRNTAGQDNSDKTGSEKAVKFDDAKIDVSKHSK